jgi:hypothetical protein
LKYRSFRMFSQVNEFSFNWLMRLLCFNFCCVYW